MSTENSNMLAFLSVIRRCEGTWDENGYKALFGYKPGSNAHTFSDFSKHPNISTKWTNKRTGKTVSTTAAGAYQFIFTTWEYFRKKLSLPDFSHDSQDAAAIAQINECGAGEFLKSGDLSGAVYSARNVWASLPGNAANQPQKSFSQIETWFADAGGRFSEVEDIPEVSNDVTDADIEISEKKKVNYKMPLIIAACTILFIAAFILLKRKKK